MNCGSRQWRPRGIYEGAFASRAPYVSLPGEYQVGLTDIAMGRFGWVDPATGFVSNTSSSGASIGIIVPRFGLWSLTYFQSGTWFLRSGKPVTLAVRGDFWLRFPYGAAISQTVYADPSTGIAYGADGGGFTRTVWSLLTNCDAGSLAKVSPYPTFGD